jgi:hypothetical protein
MSLRLAGAVALAVVLVAVPIGNTRGGVDGDGGGHVLAVRLVEGVAVAQHRDEIVHQNQAVPVHVHVHVHGAGAAQGQRVVQSEVAQLL